LWLGIVIAAVIGVVLPGINPGLVRGHAFVSYLVMVAIGIPMYVCAAASTPIAAGLIAGGVSPGAAMVFLLAGPATNVGSLVILRSEFGTRILAAYIAMIAASSIALGALLWTPWSDRSAWARWLMSTSTGGTPRPPPCSCACSSYGP
jgi:hypothetical protein